MIKDQRNLLSPDLETRLDSIKLSLQSYWNNGRYRHFINQGIFHSEQVYKHLWALLGAVPSKHQLDEAERFVLLASCWLYEIGMQSPILQPVLDFSYVPGKELTIGQLERIRKNKHLLSHHLIINGTQDLGVLRPLDDYTLLVAEVCRWCCNEPLEAIPEELPVFNSPIRVRLLSALLRLADRLYIHRSRIEPDLLEAAGLPVDQLAEWWIFQYTQTVPLDRGKIHFYYTFPDSLEAKEKEYLEPIRRLAESRFEYDNNAAVRFLTDNFELLIRPSRTHVRVDYRHSNHHLREMGSELMEYLRMQSHPRTKSDENQIVLNPTSPSNRHLQLLMEELEAVYKQLSYTIGEVDRVRIKRQIEQLENEIDLASKRQHLGSAFDTVIKILFLTANPSDTTRLKLGEELRAVDNSLRLADFRDCFEVREHFAVRVTDLQGYLLRHRPNIVHFSGHGSEQNEIILQDDTGKSKPVPVGALKGLFAVLRDNVQCVVLNACFSEPQAEGIAEHIDCVVGMSKEIKDTSSISFSAAFYQALGFGRDLQTAFDLACNQIDLEDLKEQDIPRLIAKRIDPRSIMFTCSR